MTLRCFFTKAKGQWLLVALISTVIGTGCSWKGMSQRDVYKESRNGNKIVVPEPLTGGNISNLYDLPEPGAQQPVDIMPPLE